MSSNSSPRRSSYSNRRRRRARTARRRRSRAARPSPSPPARSSNAAPIEWPGVSETPTPTQVEAPVHTAHARVIEQSADDRATITILAPRNPFRIGYLSSLVFGPLLTLLAAEVALVILGVRRAGVFVLALVACGVAWLAAELPGLLRGL